MPNPHERENPYEREQEEGRCITCGGELPSYYQGPLRCPRCIRNIEEDRERQERGQ